MPDPRVDWTTLNWALKVLAKMALSRLPLRYKTFTRLGMFRHGHMDRSAYAIGVFTKHQNLLGGSEAFAGKVCLELGPGDTVASAILAHATGAKAIYLVDAGNFADPSSETYERLIDDLAAEGYRVSDLRGFSGLQDLLDRTGARYLTEGLASLRSIPAGSVDMIWSQAVLEHIRDSEVSAVLSEMRRILSDTGMMSHRIDYKDHLGGSLNNLRLPSRLWEAEIMARSGFYTNRIRNSEYLRLLAAAGFELTHLEVNRWDEIPVPRRKIAKEFRSLSDDDLLTSGVNVVARVAAT